MIKPATGWNYVSKQIAQQLGAVAGAMQLVADSYDDVNEFNKVRCRCYEASKEAD